MTKEEHIKKHRELHKAFDELFADFILHAQGRTTSTILDLINWSHTQTIEPTIKTRQYKIELRSER